MSFDYDRFFNDGKAPDAPDAPASGAGFDYDQFFEKPAKPEPAKPTTAERVVDAAKTAVQSLASAQPAAGQRRRGGLRSEVKPYVASEPTPAAPAPAGLSDAEAPRTAADALNVGVDAGGHATLPPLLERPAPDFVPSQADLVEMSKSPQKRLQDAAARRPVAEAKAPTAAQSIAMGVRDMTSNPVARGAVSGFSELGKVVPGALRLAADIAGADSVAAFAGGAAGAADKMGAASAQGLRGNEKLVADVTSSIVNSLPSLAIGVAGGPALRTLFAQSALNEYNAGRDAGFDVSSSLTRAGIMGFAEALGERFGFPEQIRILKGAAKGMPTGEMAKAVGELLKKEIPGEQLTTAMQFMADKLGPAALAPNATLDDYLEAAGQTLAVTIGQTAVMGGGPAAINQTRQEQRRIDARDLTPGDRAAGEVAGAISDQAERWSRYFSGRDPEADGKPAAPRPPTKARADAIRRFDELAAAFGLNPAAAQRVREQAAELPADETPGFLTRITAAMSKRGLFKRQVDDAGVEQLHGTLNAPDEPAPPAAEQGNAAAEGQAPIAAADVLGAPEPESLDAKAHQAATSPSNDLPEPTDGQKEAGNYKMGHVRISGLDVSIENPQGSVRRGVDPNGKAWENTLQSHYGYIRGTEGADGDHVDAFIKPGTPGDYDGPVFIIDQVKPGTSTLDEHKVMLGFDEAEALPAYLANYAKGWKGAGAITKMSMAEFKDWVKNGDHKAPVAPADLFKGKGNVDQPDVAVPAAGAVGTADGRAPDAGRSVGALGPVASDAAGRVAGTASAPAGRGTAPGSVGNGAGKQDAAVGQNGGAAPDVAPKPDIESGPAKGGVTGAATVSRHIRPVEDDRLQQQEWRDELLASKSDIGWSEIGGRIIRDPRTAVDPNSSHAHLEGDVVGRTQWLGSDLWRNRPTEGGRINEDDAREAVDLALAGQPMSTRQRRFVEYALDAYDERKAAREQQIAEALDEALVEAMAEEQDNAVEAFWSSLSEIEAQEEELAKQEGDRSADTQDAAGDRAVESSTAGQPPPGDRGAAQEARAPDSGEGLTLSAQTEQVLREKADREAAARRREKDEQERLASKAKADAQRDEFALTGSDRPADVAAAAGQMDLLSASPSQANPEPVKVTPNKVFTEDAAAAARERLRKKLGRLNSGLDPETLMDGIILAGYHIEKGARTFAAYARAMLDDLGDAVRPYLKSWYLAAKYDPRFTEFAVGMDGAAAVEAAEIPEAGDAQRSDTDLERDRPTGEAQQLEVPDGTQPGASSGSAGADRRRAAREEGRPAGDPVVPGDGADAAGAARDQDLFAEPSTAPVGVPGDPVGERGRADGAERPLAEALTDEGALQAAQRAAADRNARLKAQKAAEKLPLDPADPESIRASLPVLLPQQQDDVIAALDRFRKDDGYGMLFTNGTGTGKTFSALGIAKTFHKQGKTNILIVAPNQEVVNAWLHSGPMVGVPISQLSDTKDMGSGPVVTTYANLKDNDALAKRNWDLLVADEAHSLSSNLQGDTTEALEMVRALTLHPLGVERRTRALHPDVHFRIQELNAQAEAAEKDGNRGRMAVVQAQLEPLLREWARHRTAVRDVIDGSQGAARPRLVMLSATPFAYHKSLRYANGYLFDWDADADENARGSAEDQFFIRHLGYRIRYGKLTQPDPKNVDIGLMERQLNTWLRRQGVLSGRSLDVDADYDRRFVAANSQIGRRIDEAFEWFRALKPEDHPGLPHDEEAGDGYEQQFNTAKYRVREKLRGQFNYQARMRLLEALKAEAAVPYIREHMANGRKAVVFHDRIQGQAHDPFKLSFGEGSPEAKPEQHLQAAIWSKWRAAFPDLVAFDFVNLKSPIQTMGEAFGSRALTVNGTNSKKQNEAALGALNDDRVEPVVVVVQSDKEAGWSGHDTTGKHARVLINLGLPTRPTRAIQQEGRIYRVGQVSNAMFRYFNTQTAWERHAFAATMARRASTAENLAMGEQARGLLDAYIEAFEDTEAWPPGYEGEGTGGKQRDREMAKVISEFDRAKTLYFAQLAKRRRDVGQEGADYFATPEPLGLKMVQWADLRAGEAAMEPSAGHGAIARWLPDSVNRIAIEPSSILSSRLALAFDGAIRQHDFESLDPVNKADAIVMNPPFGVGGKTAIEHLDKAYNRHLLPGGRIVALIPEGPAADKRLDEWLNGVHDVPVRPAYKHPTLGPIYAGDEVETGASFAPSGTVVGMSGQTGSQLLMIRVAGKGYDSGVPPDMVTKVVSAKGKRKTTAPNAPGASVVATIHLPAVTFKRAATQVRTRIVVIDKLAKDQQPAVTSAIDRDLSSIDDVGALFDAIESVDLPERTKPRPAEAEEAAPAAAKREQPAKKDPADEGEEIARANGLKVVDYTTTKGKQLRVYEAAHLSRQQAEEIEGSAWKPRGAAGFYVKTRNLPAMMAKYPPPGMPLLSQATGGASVVSPGEIRQAISKAIEHWSTAPGMPSVSVVASFGELPGDVQRMLAAQGATNTARGMLLPDGRVFIIADKVASPADAERVLFHEVYGHFGMRAYLGDRYEGTMALLRMGNDRLAAAANRWYATYGQQQVNARVASGMDAAKAGGVVRALAVEEALADMASDGKPPKGWKLLMARLQRALRAMGLDGVANWLESMTEAETHALLMNARKVVLAPHVNRTVAAAAPALSQNDPTLTPEFKRWFGDWQALRAQRIVDAMEPVQVAIPDAWSGLDKAALRAKVAELLDAAVKARTVIRHPELGDIRIGARGARKTISASPDPAKLVIAADLENVLPKSIVLESQPGDRQGVDVRDTLAARVKVGETELVALFAVNLQSDGRWYYNTVVVSDAQKEDDPGAYAAPGAVASPLGQPLLTGVAAFVRRPFVRVKPETVSKVVDAEGRPLVVYHGTRTADQLVGDRGFDRYGAHFGTHSQANTRAVGEGNTALLPAYLSILNPKRVVDANAWANEIAKAKKQGHDGIVYLNRYEGGGRGVGDGLGKLTDEQFAKRFPEARDSWIAFEPEQIKSAIGNRGTFDPNEPSILLSQPTPAAPAALRPSTGAVDVAVRVPVQLANKAAARAVNRVLGISAKTLTSGAYNGTIDMLDRAFSAFGGKAYEYAKAGLVDRYGLAPGHYEAKTAMKTAIRVNARRTKEIIDRVRALDAAQSRIAYLWMSDKTDETAAERALMDQLPEEARLTLESLKRDIEYLQDEAVALGLITPDSRERNRNAYMHRSYQRYELESPAAKVAKSRVVAIHGDQLKMRGMRDDATMAQIGTDDWWERKTNKTAHDPALKGKQFYRLERRSLPDQATPQLFADESGQPLGKLREVVYWPNDEPIPDRYADWRNEGLWEARWFDRKDKVGMFRDFSLAERTRMGEIQEVKYAVAATMLQMVRDVETARFLEWVAHNEAELDPSRLPDDAELVAASERLARSYLKNEWVKVPETEIAGTGVKRFGLLGGRYVPGPVWNDIRQIASLTDRGDISEAYAKILRAWKISKTALSPVTHMNNVMSNFILADAHDIQARHIYQALQAWATMKSDPEARKVIEAYQDNGGDAGMFNENEVRKELFDPLMAELREQIEQDTGQPLVTAAQVLDLLQHRQFRQTFAAIGHTKAAQALSWAPKKLMKLYGIEDEVFRLAAFLKARADGLSDREAGQFARDSFLNYEITAPWINAMRRTAWPFIAFTYRAAPMLARAAAERPEKFVKWWMLLAAANAFAYWMLGDDGDEEAERALMSDEKAGHIWGFMGPKLVRMPWNDRANSPVFLDIRRWIPGGDIVDLGQTHAALPLVPPPLMPGGPAWLAAEFLLNTSAFTGRDITLQSDTLAERASKSADYLWKGIAPNMPGVPGTYATEGISDALRGKTFAGPFGQEQSSVSQAALNTVGVKVRSYPIDALAHNAKAAAYAETMEIVRQLTADKRLKDRRGISEEEYRRREAAAKEKIARISQELKAKLSAAGRAPKGLADATPALAN